MLTKGICWEIAKTLGHFGDNFKEKLGITHSDDFLQVVPLEQKVTLDM